ncbi:DUF2231 domain-containing protein [Candidatus Uabimicrobium amorphum]|uniref:Cytochrome c n=1 Tax=Uabimicrobium amorphum TaxID=2596890 RepID=A0A5S9IRZ2_UABAM|nr:DUF2231 domain-containing protein [Candidatus Uabimicrobium amorphum]BBM87058.1 cytochrome c [Candidatus Uabimicrobium amorphum]
MSRMSVAMLFLLTFSLTIYGDVEVNSMCPVMPDEEIDKAIFTDYQNKKVYLCCKRCLKKFLKTPDTYVKNLPQFIHKNKVTKHGNHQHENHQHGSQQKHFNFLHFMSKFHPPSTHFPIALILSAMFFEVLFWWKKKSIFQEMARIMVLMAALMSVVTVVLGWFAGTFSSYPGELGSVLEVHRWLGTSTGIFIIITSIFSELYHRKKENRYKVIYKFSLCISSMLVIATGHFGGTLIYGLNYYG